MGMGTRFVNQHLSDGCKGPGYKTRKHMANGTYAGREQEAQLNTAIYNAQRMIKDEQEATRTMVTRIKADIERMKEMGSYAQTIF